MLLGGGLVECLCFGYFLDTYGCLFVGNSQYLWVPCMLLVPSEYHVVLFGIKDDQDDEK